MRRHIPLLNKALPAARGGVSLRRENGRPLTRIQKGQYRKVALCIFLSLCAVSGLMPQIASAQAKPISPRVYRQDSSRAGHTKGKKVIFSGTRITIPVIAVSPGSPSATFEVHGKVDPTLVVPAGARVRIRLANADKGMLHGLDVTLDGPPYAVSTGLPTRKTSEHQRANGGAKSAATAIVAVGLVPRAGGRHWEVKDSAWFSLKPGVYHYVCPVPGHARKGMHGRIIAVKASRH